MVKVQHPACWQEDELFLCSNGYLCTYVILVPPLPSQSSSMSSVSDTWFLHLVIYKTCLGCTSWIYSGSFCIPFSCAFQRFVNIFFSVYADDSPLYLYVNPIDTYSLAAIMARFRKLYFKLAWKIDFNMLTLCHYIVLCICRWYPVSLDSNQNVENQVPGSSQSWFYQLRNISKVKPISLCCYSVIEDHSVKTN